MEQSIRKLVTRGAFAFALTATFIPATGVTAASPNVAFDVAPTVECRDVTTEEFAHANPNERLVEATFQVSSLIRGNEDDLIQFFYRIENPWRSVQVVDYLPKTTLTTDLAGNVGIEKKKEDIKNLGLNLSGAYGHMAGIAGTGNIGSKDNDCVHYELLPPMELLAASGTLDRGSGVYYKLKPSRRTTLEGGKEFVVVLRVPGAWRADRVHLHCFAQGYERGPVRSLDERTISGRGDFVVALYAAGDAEAKAAALTYASAEAQLRRVAVSSRRDIKKRNYPTVVHHFGALISVVDPKIPNGWLTKLLFAPGDGGLSEYVDRLPAEAKAAAVQYLNAKVELTRLNGSPQPSTLFTSLSP